MLENLLGKLIRRTRRDDAGFTLIELLVVITILGILAAVVVFLVAGVGDKGQATACQSDTTTIRTAEESYYASKSGGNGSYGPMSALVSGGFLSKQSTLHGATGSGNSYTITNIAPCADA